MADHFVKTWCERNFSLLLPELQQACLSDVSTAMVSTASTGSSVQRDPIREQFITFPVINSTHLEPDEAADGLRSCPLIDNWILSLSLITEQESGKSQEPRQMFFCSLLANTES